MKEDVEQRNNQDAVDLWVGVLLHVARSSRKLGPKQNLNEKRKKKRKMNRDRKLSRIQSSRTNESKQSESRGRWWH